MIYICVPCHNEAATVGVLLWKIRRIFEEFPREYHLIVADDGSDDATPDVLAPYAKVLPLTILRSETRTGYAATVERLLRHALEQTDRPKRDAAILLHADFTHDAATIPELVRRIESGADFVVAEGTVSGEAARSYRWIRRWAPLLVRRRVAVPEVRDLVSGFVAVRLVSLRNALRQAGDRLLTTDGWAANAELIGRIARTARRTDTVATTIRHDLRQRPSRVEPWAAARLLWQSRRDIRLPKPTHRPRTQDGGERREAA
jgi:glycosyltransferase involved in cell wall biosynthesis